MSYFRWSVAGDYDLPQAPAKAWFCQLQIVCRLEFWELFRGYINARVPRGRVGCWFIAVDCC